MRRMTKPLSTLKKDWNQGKRDTMATIRIVTNATTGAKGAEQTAAVKDAGKDMELIGSNLMNVKRAGDSDAAADKVCTPRDSYKSMELL